MLLKLKMESTDSPVCLVISDWNMPEMDGLELLKKVRGIKSLKGLPFLIVTADALENDMVQAVKAGVSGILLKPFDMKQLKEKIENALE
jgi:two-component system chemotaxis response regulator CheY